jgi:hypothetical protein
MARFTTRVELHNADWSDYTALHREMKSKGFLLTIADGDGHVYALPPAEYNYVGDITKEDVLSKARSAAGAVKPSFEVFVTESSGRTWHGLKPA